MAVPVSDFPESCIDWIFLRMDSVSLAETAALCSMDERTFGNNNAPAAPASRNWASVCCCWVCNLSKSASCCWLALIFVFKLFVA